MDVLEMTAITGMFDLSSLEDNLIECAELSILLSSCLGSDQI